MQRGPIQLGDMSSFGNGHKTKVLPFYVAPRVPTFVEQIFAVLVWEASNSDGTHAAGVSFGGPFRPSRAVARILRTKRLSAGESYASRNPESENQGSSIHMRP